MKSAIKALFLVALVACVACFLATVNHFRGTSPLITRAAVNGTSGCDVWGQPREQLCAVFAEKCPSGSVVNYLHVLFCSPLSKFLLGTVVVVEMVMLFFLLGASADQFLVPSLLIISNTLGIPPDIAGITLMALANGAPDVFGTFVAVSQNAYGISVGELFGAGLFVTTVVVGGVALVSVAKVQQFSFLRDAGFYVLGIVIFMGMLLDGFVSLLDAFVMLVFYVGYVCFASFMSLRQRRQFEAQQVVVAEEPATEDAEVDVELSPVEAVNKAEEDAGDDLMVEALRVEVPDEWRFPSVNLFLRKWRKKSVGRRVLWLVFAFLRIPLTLSCPDLRSSKWDRFWVAGTFLFSPFVVVFASGLLTASIGGGLSVWALTLSVAFALTAVWLLLLWRQPQPPEDWRQLALAFWTFLLSIAWIYLLAHELVGILQALGTLMKISDVILGATVLAWGSSVGDTVSNILVAKQGFPETSIAATFGGPLFNLLFGSSLSLLYMTVKMYPAQYAAPLQLDSLVTAIFLIGNVAVCVGVVHWQRYTIPRWFAAWLFAVYLAYDVVLILFGVGAIGNPFINA